MTGRLDVVTGADVLRGLVELRGGARGEVNVAAFRGQRMGDGKADALRGAGDECRSAGKIEVQLLVSP